MSGGERGRLAEASASGPRSAKALAAVCVLIVAWTAAMSALEPVMLDGWFIEQWQGSFVDYVRANWNGELFWGNPRLGQWVTAFTYDEVFHVIFTPLLVLALFLLMLTHLRGRLPNAGDAWALLVLVGVTVLAQPQLGPVLFYRPFTANYVVGLVVQLAWMLPFRFALERDVLRSPLAALAMLVLGVAAGACNEHTGPALALAGVIVLVRFARQRRLRIWMVAGVVGFIAGYVAMMLAPAQATRYCGVATEMGLAERIVERGIVGNLKVVFGLVIAGRWAWIALVIAAIALRKAAVPRRRAALAWIALGVAISVTLLASPKQGDRLQFAALMFATLGMVILLEDLAGERARRAIAVLAGVITAVAIVWSLAIQARVSEDYADRRELLAAATPGSVAQVPALRHRASRWFLGDDLPSDALRHHVAHIYKLEAIDLEGHPAIPYRLAIRYRLASGAGPTTAPQFIPLHLCEARRDFAAEVSSLHSGHGAQLTAAELAVVPRTPIFEGRPLAASRWRDGRLLAPGASVVNEGYTRWIRIDPGGLTGELAVSIIGPGRTERLTESGGRWPYRPWARGTYWIVVCVREDCYLAEIVRHTDV